ncbi:alpha/beta fold hydrolase [Leucobacter sp. HY1908]
MFEARTHLVYTRDGRTLTGSSIGPTDGHPVLFISGAATGKSMTFGDEYLSQTGLLLVTMDRPGIGGSTPDTTRTLASTADDYRNFMREVTGSDAPFHVVANSQGSVFALQLAASKVLESLTSVSPADELAHPAIHAQLPAEATALADLARHDPDQAATILAGLDMQAMESMVLAGSHPSDAAFYRSEPFATRYRDALAEGFACDGAGYARDTLIAMRPWGIELDTIACPVTMLFGALDLSHSPDHGATLASRITGATRTVLQDAGGALLWTHSRLVLDTVLDAMPGTVLGTAPELAD